MPVNSVHRTPLKQQKKKRDSKGNRHGRQVCETLKQNIPLKSIDEKKTTQNFSVPIFDRLTVNKKKTLINRQKNTHTEKKQRNFNASADEEKTNQRKKFKTL